MRTFIVISYILLLQPLVSIGQTSSGVVIGSEGKIVAMVDNLNRTVIPTIKQNNIEGSPYLGNGWGNGRVFFKKGKIADNLELLFNLKDNQLLFRQDGIILNFIDEVVAFTFTYIKDSASNQVFFKSGYGKNRNSENKFYQVLSTGKQYELLLFPRMIIQEEYIYNGEEKKKYSPIAEWYVYDVINKELKKVKADKEVLTKKIPAAAARISQLCTENKWDLKTEEGMVKLFDGLNGGK